MLFYGYRKKYSARFGSIPAGWQVHHINGRRYDNRLANLVAIPAFLHGEYHKTKPRGWQWLQRDKDGRQINQARRQAEKHLEAIRHISRIYYLRGKPKEALKYWNNH